MRSFFSIRNLKVSFKAFEGTKNVIDLEALSIQKGETFGLVGESGAGKSVLAYSILKLLSSPPAIISGDAVELDGDNLLAKNEREMMDIRGRKVAMIFQGPMDFPGEQSIYQYAGIAYSYLGNYDQAIARRRQAVAIRPTPVGYFNLAVAYDKSGRYKEAAENFALYLRNTQGESEESVRRARAELERLNKLLERLPVPLTLSGPQSGRARPRASRGAR